MPHKLDNLDNWTDFLKSVRYETDSRRNRNSDYLYNYHKNQIFFFFTEYLSTNKIPAQMASLVHSVQLTRKK